MGSGGKEKIKLKEKLPKLPRCPLKTRKAFQADNLFAYSDQTKLVPT